MGYSVTTLVKSDAYNSSPREQPASHWFCDRSRMQL